MKNIYLIAVFMILLSYGVFASPNQPNNNTVGYEFLDSSQVLHIWNENDDYYFNYSSGIQLTNHYQDYWAKNIFCGGLKIGSWNYYCTDSLPFSWNVNSDNTSFVIYSGYKDISAGQYSLRISLDYYLRSGDTQISVTPSFNNTGANIPVDFAFAWKLKDIQVDMTQENDIIYVNNTNYNLNSAANNTYNFVDRNFFKIVDNTESLKLEWDAFANYSLTVKSEAGQYNAPVTLSIFFNTLPSGQKKSTTIYWIDDINCYTMWGNKYDPAGNYPSNTKFSDGNRSWGMTCHIDPTSTACPQPSGTPASCNRAVCTISKRLGNGSWVSVANTAVDQNCATDDISEGAYADLSLIAMSSNGDLAHNILTDFRCVLDTRVQEEICLVTTQATDTKNDYWYNNNTPTAVNVTVFPINATDDNDLNCSYGFYDADGDSQNVSARVFTWVKNGNNTGINNQTLAKSITNAGETWSCGVKVFDNVFVTGNEVVSYSPSIFIRQATVIKSYFYVDGKLILSSDSKGNKRFYHSDYLGSTRVITNQSGNNLSTIDYYPFGSMFRNTGEISKYSYTGKELDKTNLQYFGARYYDPEIGRFTQVDPIFDPVTSPYIYAENNPLKFNDPDGRNPVAALSPLIQSLRNIFMQYGPQITMYIQTILDDPTNRVDIYDLTSSESDATTKSLALIGLGIEGGGFGHGKPGEWIHKIAAKITPSGLVKPVTLAKQLNARAIEEVVDSARKERRMVPESHVLAELTLTKKEVARRARAAGLIDSNRIYDARVPHEVIDRLTLESLQENHKHVLFEAQKIVARATSEGRKLTKSELDELYQLTWDLAAISDQIKLLTK